MSESNDAFGAIREFLHSHTPDQESRKKLFVELSRAHHHDPEFYHAECLPYVKGFESWYAEPLDWCTFPTWNSASYYRHPVMFHEAYRAVMPFGPLALAICTLSSKRIRQFDSVSLLDELEEEYNIPGEMPEKKVLVAELKRCTMLKSAYAITYDESTSQEFQEFDLYIEELSKPLRTLFRKTPELTHFELSSSLWHTPGWNRIGRHKPSTLRRALFQAIAKQKKLESLKLSCGLNVKDVWRHLNTNWPQLKKLDLSHNAWGEARNFGRPSDRPLCDLFPQEMPELEVLSFKKCPHLQDDDVRQLFEQVSFPRLRELDLRDTPLSNDLPEKLLGSKNLPVLEQVMMSQVEP